MPKSTSRRRPPAHPLVHWHEEFVRISGTVTRVVVEKSPRPEKIDHVWIDLRAGDAGVLQIALSTFSRQSQSAGFDPRVWLGVSTATEEEPAPPGIEPAAPLDYATFEAARAIKYIACERPALEKLIVEKAERAVHAHAWGDLYVRGGKVGLHQVHSRRASFAVPIDHVGRDGALQFFYGKDAPGELLFFKFAGQP